MVEIKNRITIGEQNRIINIFSDMQEDGVLDTARYLIYRKGNHGILIHKDYCRLYKVTLDKVTYIGSY